MWRLWVVAISVATITFLISLGFVLLPDDPSVALIIVVFTPVTLVCLFFAVASVLALMPKKEEAEGEPPANVHDLAERRR